MSSHDNTSPAYAWLGRLRKPLRATFFGVLRQALETDDGRRLLADSLAGLLAREPQIPESLLDGAETVYAGLGRAPNRAAELLRAPIFITGRFRSGSTLLWNIFRNLEGCRAYYEPLNERRWFDPSRRGSHTDATHLGVSDYWREYEGLEHLGGVFDDHWIDRHLFMDEGFWDPRLKAYVQALIDHAAPARPVLQFNRVDFRLPWLRRTFPNARLLHIYRHPRDQWCSALGDLALFPKDAPIGAFAPHDRFYLRSWANDLSYRFPFLDERQATHPYQLFYLIWKLSWLFGRHYAHYSVGLEQLVRDRDTELPSMLAAMGVAAPDLDQLKALIVSQPSGKWRAYADEGWFERHESACEAVLHDWLGSGRRISRTARLDHKPMTNDGIRRSGRL